MRMWKLKRQTKPARNNFACYYLSVYYVAGHEGPVPNEIGVKAVTEPDLFAVCQIGQRLTPEFTIKHAQGIDRVFIVWDGMLQISRTYKYPSG
jgi:hypothetical protein